MDQTERKHLALALSATMEVYGKTVTPTMAEVWIAALDGFTVAQIRGALSAHMRDPDTGQYPPKPADVVRLLRGTSADNATLAWVKVTAAMRGVGGYASVVFDDPAIHAAIESMGGWPKLCVGEEAELPFRERDFRGVYTAMRNRGGFEYPAVLAGRSEIECIASGHAARVPAPVLCGDRQSCEVVRLSGRGTTSAPALAHESITRLLPGVTP